MTAKKLFLNNDLNGEQEENITSPSQLRFTEPATMAGFSFLSIFRDTMGTKIKHFDYKPPKLHDKGKWFVYYSVRQGSEMVRKKVYKDINRIKDEEEKREYAKTIIDALNYFLKKGMTPPAELKVKTWSLVQGLNYFKQQLSTRGLRKRTVQSYESVLRSMYAGLTGVLNNDINSVTKGQILTFLNSRTDWSNSTFNNNLTFVRSIFNYLVDQEIMSSNPSKGVKPLPQSIQRHRYFDDKTFQKIKDKSPPDLLRFLMFLYHTGTRPNEARQLSYSHIQRDRKLLMVPASVSKNKKDDYVPLSEYILSNFKGEGLIFGTSVNYFTQKFNKLKLELKLPKEMSLYSIKHTRAIHLAQDGASPYAIMQLFRHSSLEITMNYLRDLGMTVNREAADMAR